LAFTNCLIHRVDCSIEDGGATLTSHWRNNSFIGGHTYWNTPSSAVNIFDNLFDYTTNTLGAPVTHNYNAYLTNATRLTNNGLNDVVLAATTYGYQTNSWGQFYIPSTGFATNLFNAGSTYATNIGLYHFTCTTNQWKETNSVLDIGFHYVALGGNGLPIDTDGDGIPDYLEDANGNGVITTGETDWQAYTSIFGISGTVGLQVFTPLKR